LRAQVFAVTTVTEVMSSSLRSRRLRKAGIGAALAAAGLTAVAIASNQSGSIQVMPSSQKTLTIAAVKTRTCRAALTPGAQGVSVTKWTAPSDGYVTQRLKGAGSTNDWDLALYGQSGRLLDSSTAFGANEVVQSYVRQGQELTLQACRLSGRSTQEPLSTTFVRLNLAKLSGPAPKQSLIKVSIPGRKGIALLQKLGFDLGEDATPTSVSVVIHSAQERTRLLQAGFKYRTVIDDLAAADRRNAQADAAYAAKYGKSPTPTGRTTYRVFQDVQDELKKLVTDYPGLVRAVTLPHKSFQGRDIQGVEIAKNVDATDDNRPTFMLVAMHHAREWPSVEAAMEFAWMLVKNQSDPRIAKILKNTRVVMVPTINADGYIDSRGFPIDDPDGSQSAGVIPTAFGVMPPGGYGSYRRKNCDGLIPSGAVPCELQYGVDPNRNYGQFWGGPGASSDPTTQTYRGTGPWSEPETQNVHEWSRAHDVTTLITLHNVAALVLRPPGLASQGLAPDEQRLKLLGDKMAKDTGYTSQYGWQLYDTTGTTEDWNYAAAGTFGYTIEIGPPGGAFHQDYESGFIDQWTGGNDAGPTKGKGLRDALLLAAENSFEPIDHSILAGRAPGGRILHLHKTFVTQTSDVCLVADIGPTGEGGCNLPSGVQDIPDLLDYTTVVPSSGKFSWIITPSTRPFVRKAGGTEAWTLTCEDASKKVIQTEQIVVGVGQKVTKDLPCGGKLPKAKKKSKKKAKHKAKKKRKK
jgi:Zinc carboxypeptidase